MDSTIPFFISGVHNLLPNEDTPEDSTQDELGFVVQDGRTKLIPGRVALGAVGAAGKVRGAVVGFKFDGTQIFFRKIETKIQYFDGANWQDIVTGLTSGAEYTLSAYASLAGTFVIATGIDGIFKIHTASPGSYLAMYDPAVNDKGKSFVDKGRLLMWDLSNASKTALKMSHIDPQDSTVYTTVPSESLGSGDGATKTFSGTLGFKASNASIQNIINCFGIQVLSPVVALVNITALTKATQAQVSATGHGLSVGDTVLFAGVGGMVEINNLFGSVLRVIDANTFTVNINSSGFSAFTAGGTIGKCELFTDDRVGNLKSPAGGTGTINYITGAYSITFNTAPLNGSSVRAAYQWENSNNKGITDFTFTVPIRVPSEGNLVTQDRGGDPIVTVLVGQDGAYYSLKQQLAYRLAISTDDKTFDNHVFYENMGIPFFRAAISTQVGIVFINTSNPDKPEFTHLKKNAIGDAIVPDVLFKHFKFANYDYSDAFFDTYERFIIIGCKQKGSKENDRILLCNIEGKTVDISPYEARMAIKDNSANLYVGSPFSQTMYQIFNGFDDLGNPIGAYWISRAEQYAALKARQRIWRFIREQLKKFRRLRIKGLIDPNQKVGVYVSYDDAGFNLIGTILGTGSYVDPTQPQAIGSNFLGGVHVGGDVTTNSFPYFMDIKLHHQPKFRKRTIKLIPTGIGYFDFDYMSDWDIMLFENRLPSRFRQKQKVSLDGKTTNN